MHFVVEQIVAAVLAITSFSIQSNPKAPDGAAVLQYAVDDADAMVHIDVVPLARNYLTFTKLPDDKLIKQLPELRAGLREAVTQAEAARGMARTTVGFDPVTDLTSITMFARFRANADPDVLVVVRGKLPADLPTRLAKQGGRASQLDGRPMVTMPDGTAMVLTAGGDLLVGNAALVTERAKSTWKPKAHAASSPWGRVAATLDTRPFFLIASHPSPAAIKEMTKDLGKNFGADLLASHELAVFTASSNGIGWMYLARNAAMAKRVKAASEGVVDLIRASHLAPRGLAQIVAAALPSYARLNKEIDAVIAQKDKLLGAVKDLTGDGTFAANIRLDGKLVSVQLTGSKLSDVLPGTILMAGGMAAFMVRARGDDTAVMPPAQVAPPRRGGTANPPRRHPAEAHP